MQNAAESITANFEFRAKTQIVSYRESDALKANAGRRRRKKTSFPKNSRMFKFKSNYGIINGSSVHMHRHVRSVCRTEKQISKTDEDNAMKAQIIDGKKLAADTRAEIARGVAELKEARGVTPGLAVILVGDNPASVSYVTAKEKACREAGMLSREIRLPATISEDELISEIEKLNADPLIHGILVQLPLPKGFSEKRVIDLETCRTDNAYIVL